MNNSQVAHIWAQNNGENAKGSNFFCETDGTIYSYGYHFPAAKFYLGTVILLDGGYYSSSTCKHQAYIRQSLPYATHTIFDVPNVVCHTKLKHRENYKYLLNQSKTNLEKSKRARSNKPYLIQAAQQFTEQANNYTKIFKLGYKQLSTDMGGINKRFAADIKRAEKKRKKQLAAEKKAALTAVKVWREYEDFTHDSAAHRAALRNAPIQFLRLKQTDPDTIETSIGAEFPAAHAIRAWPLIRRIYKSGKCFKANGHTIKLGHFTIDRIDNNGTVYAGCHTVEYSEVERMAKILGLEV